MHGAGRVPLPPQHRVIFVGGPLAEPAEELLQLGRQLRVPLPEAQGPVLPSHPDERDDCTGTGVRGAWRWEQPAAGDALLGMVRWTGEGTQQQGSAVLVYPLIQQGQIGTADLLPSFGWSSELEREGKHGMQHQQRSPANPMSRYQRPCRALNPKDCPPNCSTSGSLSSGSVTVKLPSSTPAQGWFTKAAWP